MFSVPGCCVCFLLVFLLGSNSSPIGSGEIYQLDMSEVMRKCQINGTPNLTQFYRNCVNSSRVLQNGYMEKMNSTKCLDFSEDKTNGFRLIRQLTDPSRDFYKTNLQTMKGDVDTVIGSLRLAKVVNANTEECKMFLDELQREKILPPPKLIKSVNNVNEGTEEKAANLNSASPAKQATTSILLGLAVVSSMVCFKSILLL